MVKFRMPSEEEVRAGVERGRALHAQAVRDLLAGAVRALGAPFRRLAEWARREAVIAELSQLSDRQLKDIGIARSEIPAVALGVHKRPDPVRPARPIPVHETAQSADDIRQAA